MNQKQYHKYLNSPEWKAKKEPALERDDYACTDNNYSFVQMPYSILDSILTNNAKVLFMHLWKDAFTNNKKHEGKHYDGISIDEMDYIRDDLLDIEHLIGEIVTKIVLLNWLGICSIIFILVIRALI